MKKFISLVIGTFLFSLSTFALTSAEISEVKKYSIESIYSKLRAGDRITREAISAKKININKENVIGYTVLSYAAIDNEIEIVKFLLANGAKPDAGLNFPLYEICWASEKPKDQSEVINLLVAAGANINKKHKNSSDTPLMATLKKQNGKYARLLINSGAKTGVTNSSGQTALIVCADYLDRANCVSIMRLLIEKGSDVNVRDKNGNTALSVSASRGFSEVVKILLEKGANPNNPEKKPNEIPILNACYSGDTECVKLLLKYGADITVKDSYGVTALENACISKDNAEIVEICINGGCDVNYVDPTSGMTPFMIAAIWNHKTQMKLLVDRGARVNIENPQIGNLLMFIIANGIKEANPPYYPANDLGGAIYGIDLGMNVSVRNARGESPRSYVVKYLNRAKESKYEDYLILMEKIIDKENRAIKYTLHEAAILGKTDFVKDYLKNKDALISQSDADGHTPLYYAKKFGRSDIVKLLTNAGATE